MSLIYQGDVGVKFTFSTQDINIPITNLILILVKKPDGTTATWTPTSWNSGTGDVFYTSVAGDLTQQGEYTVQIQSTNLPEILLSEPGTFFVYATD